MTLERASIVHCSRPIEPQGFAHAEWLTPARPGERRCGSWTRAEVPRARFCLLTLLRELAQREPLAVGKKQAELERRRRMSPAKA